MVATGSKFTQARRERLLEALGKGHSITTAAGLAGISRQTFYEWLDKGEKTPDGEYGKFLLAVNEATAESAEVAVGAIRKAMPDDWRAAMEFLSRRFPDDWGKRERHEVTGVAGEPIKIEVRWPQSNTEEAQE